MGAPETGDERFELYLQALHELSPLCIPRDAIVYLHIVDGCLSQRSAGCFANIHDIAYARRLPFKEVEEALRSLSSEGFLGITEMRDGSLHFFMPNEQDENGKTTLCLMPEGFREWVRVNV